MNKLGSNRARITQRWLYYYIFHVRRAHAIDTVVCVCIVYVYYIIFYGVVVALSDAVAPRTTHIYIHTKSLEIRINWTARQCILNGHVYMSTNIFYVLYGGWPWTLHYVCLSWLHVEPENPNVRFSSVFLFLRAVNWRACVWVSECVDFPSACTTPIHDRSHARTSCTKRETWEKCKSIDEAFPYFPLCLKLSVIWIHINVCMRRIYFTIVLSP